MSVQTASHRHCACMPCGDDGICHAKAKRFIQSDGKIQEMRGGAKLSSNWRACGQEARLFSGNRSGIGFRFQAASVEEDNAQRSSEVEAREVRSPPSAKCILARVPLHGMDKNRLKPLVPAGVLARYDRFPTCRVCLGVFWKGAHWARMRTLLEGVTGNNLDDVNPKGYPDSS